MHELWYGESRVAKDMQKEQLETKFEFGLQYLNVGASVINRIGFKLKEYLKKKEPWWPMMINLFGEASLKIFNLKSC
jgi:hypothetical protein